MKASTESTRELSWKLFHFGGLNPFFLFLSIALKIYPLMMYPKKSTLNQMEQSPSSGGRDL